MPNDLKALLRVLPLAMLLIAASCATGSAGGDAEQASERSAPGGVEAAPVDSSTEASAAEAEGPVSLSAESRAIREALRSAASGVRKGCIEGDCENGEGVYVYDGGAAYRGAFREGKRQGNGVLVYQNGEFYEGSFKNDLRDGIGRYDFQNGDIYIGEFMEGRMQGIGSYIFADGTEYKGRFDLNGDAGEGVMGAGNRNRNCSVENRILYCRN